MAHFMAEIANGIASMADVAGVVSAEAELDYLDPRIVRVPVRTGRGRLESVVRFLCPATWFRLAAMIKGLHADVVHIAGVHEWNPLLAAICRLQAIPLVYTVHDPESHPGSPWAIRLADRLTVRLADKLVALTRHGRQQLVRGGRLRGEIAVVPHPMYSLFLRWQQRSTRPEKIILFLGRLEAYKGLDALVGAFEAVRRSLPSWRLIVAGGGPLPTSLSAPRPAGIEVINEYLPDREVALLMSRCSIVALPYTSATQSGVVALAQAFSRPVIVTRVGGLKEMVLHGRTGILVRPGDQVRFARALRSLAMDAPKRARMQREIRRVANTRWGARVVAERHLRVYSSAMRAKRSP